MRFSRFSLFSVALMLSISFLMILPENIGRVQAVGPSGPTRWSPWGPWMQNLIINVYQGPIGGGGSLSAFTAGQLDITDWAIQTAADVAAYSVNPDFYVTQSTSEFGFFDIAINSHAPVMGVAMTGARAVVPASLTGIVNSPGACPVGFGSLSITLSNQETGSVILDSLNTLTASNQPSGAPSVTVSDSGGTTPNGVYVTPCVLAGNYRLTTSVYGGGAVTIAVASTTKVAGTFNVNYNSLSTVNPTSARMLWGSALAQMIDKPEFVTSLFGPLASFDDVAAAPSQGLTAPTTAQLNAAECQVPHPWLGVCTGVASVVSAYNVVDDLIAGGSEWWQTAGAAIGVGMGYSGHDDLRAACDDLVLMGFVVAPAPLTCDDVAKAAAGAIPPAAYAHIVPAGHIVFYIGTLPGEKQYGTIVADTLNFLFGTPSSAGGGTVCYGACPNLAPKYFDIVQIGGTILADQASPNSWQLYTAEQSLSSLPDQLYRQYNSIFSGGICAGVVVASPSNYPFYCNPKFDTDAAAGEVSGISPGLSFFSRAAYDGLLSGLDVPIYSGNNQFVELNGWNYQQCTGGVCANTQSSIVNTVGQGTKQGFWTLLNARQVPGYVPTSALYSPGGGNPALLRRGFSEGTINLSPFIATAPRDLEIIHLIFDSLLQTNPLTGGASTQLLDWQTAGGGGLFGASGGHSSVFDPNEISCNPVNGCVTGTTTQRWKLRNDLKFQDGNPVSANDFAYSILAYRDVPSAYFQTSVVNVASAIGTDCGPGQPCRFLQVKLQGSSPYYETGIGALPVLEKSVWAPFCGDPPIAGGVCANPVFDPMAQGIMIGDGPWSCVVPAGFFNAGHVGGPCTEDATGALAGQSVVLGGRFLLSRFHDYFRCCPDDPSSGLYKLSWADKDNNGAVGAVNELAGVAIAFGTADPYWVNPNIAPGAIVNVQDLATVAIYFGHGLIIPYLPSQVTMMDPQIDPFFCPNTGC